MQERFEAAAKLAVDKDSPLSTASNEEKLKLYSLYKQVPFRALVPVCTVETISDVITNQGTVGNINTTRPGMLDMSGKVGDLCRFASCIEIFTSQSLTPPHPHQAKWDAWKALEGETDFMLDSKVLPFRFVSFTVSNSCGFREDPG
jgi:acyl-CoA-binding protein